MPRPRMVPWYVPASLGAVSVVLLATGFALALTGRFGERLGPAPVTVEEARPRRTGALRVVALGDSLSHGTGDRRGGYVARVVAAIRGRRAVELTNLSVPGDETKDLLERLGSEQTTRVLREADLVLFSAGGNDFSHALRPRSGDGLEPEEALARARTNLKEIVGRLRAANPDASIRALGLYNPFEIEAGAHGAARAQLMDWNNAIDAATHAYPGVVAVPIADLFEGRPERLAGDRFHPGGRGHELIADRVLSTLPDDWR